MRHDDNVRELAGMFYDLALIADNFPPFDRRISTIRFITGVQLLRRAPFLEALEYVFAQIGPLLFNSLDQWGIGTCIEAFFKGVSALAWIRPYEKRVYMAVNRPCERQGRVQHAGFRLGAAKMSKDDA